MSFSLRTALTFTAVSATCVTAAGCGGGGSSSALAGLSAKQVLSKAVSDLKSASSFHMAGTVNQGGSIRVDLTYSRGTGCKGTLGIGSKGSVSLLVIGGTAWLFMAGLVIFTLASVASLFVGIAMFTGTVFFSLSPIHTDDYLAERRKEMGS